MLKSGHALSAALVAIAAWSSAAAWAQTGGASSIYTCTDAKGRKITSDRPIVECLDREQKELTSTATVKRTVKPSYTAAEAAAEEEKQRKIDEETNRVAEEKKRERALLSRYPNRATHDRERAGALEAVESVIATALKRIVDLEDEKKGLLKEMEFYKKDPAKMPQQLNRKIDENASTISAQRRFISNQQQEKQRVNAKFDEELVKLNQLWSQLAKAGTPAPAPSAAEAKK